MQTVFNMSEEKEVRGCKITRVRRVCGEPHHVVSIKGDALLSRMGT
jgi:hypothetical protein